MTTTTDPSAAELKAELDALEGRFRVSQLIVSFVLAVAALAAPVIVKIDDSTDEDIREQFGIWKAVPEVHKLFDPEADFGSRASHYWVFVGIVLTIVLVLVSLAVALVALHPCSAATYHVCLGICLATAVAPVVTIIGLSMSDGASSLAGTWAVLLPTALGAWILNGLTPSSR